MIVVSSDRLSKNKKRISVAINKADYDFIKDVADKKGISFGAMTNIIIREFVDSNYKK